MKDILLIETDESIGYLDKISNHLEDMGIDMIVILPPKIYLGNQSIEQLKEYKKLIDNLLEE